MAVQITYFVHGTTTDNQKEISSGWSDVELSDLGVKQSIELKDQIKDKKFDVVFVPISNEQLIPPNLLSKVRSKSFKIPDFENVTMANIMLAFPVLSSLSKKKTSSKDFLRAKVMKIVKKRIQDFLNFLKGKI